MQAHFGIKLIERKSLVIFDEVQIFPQARAAIKYLVADGRYDYIETGSLISIKENVKDIVIPSEERHINMYPLDFEEFAISLGEGLLVEYIKKCFEKREPLERGLHNKAMLLFHQYMLVGGMPKPVVAFVEDSIADHSAYLLGAMNGSKKRYEGIAGMTDYKKVVQLIKDGGYATSLTYAEKLCSIIEKWNLTQYDVKETATEPEKWYRVRKSWADAKSQKGAYKVLKNAKACANKTEGYSVFDWNGNVVYAPTKPSEPDQNKVSYRVRVSIKNLNIRKGPGTNYDKTGKYTGIGVFTIVAEADGEGATKWGKLKSGAGWISLDYAKKI